MRRKRSKYGWQIFTGIMAIIALIGPLYTANLESTALVRALIQICIVCFLACYIKFMLVSYYNIKLEK